MNTPFYTIDGGRISIHESGELAALDSLYIWAKDQPPDSLPMRLLAILKEVEAAWRADPNGPIRLRASLVGNTYTESPTP